MAALKKQSLSGDEITVDISVTLGTADLRVQQLLKLGRHGEVVITENETIGISVTDIVKKSKR